MSKRGTVVRLDLKRAIILEDARRIERCEEPINNLWRLAVEMSNGYDGEYEADKLYKILWRAQGKGHSSHGLSCKIKPIIIHLCELLSVKEEDLIINVIN